MNRPTNPADLFGAQEELDPELAACVYDSRVLGQMIKHPLVNTLHHPHLNALHNRQLHAKREEIERATNEGRWHTVIMLHERPWRLEALQGVAQHETVDDETYWSLVSDVWIDSENIPENEEEWDDLLRSDRPGHEHMMTVEEREALAALPETIRVYQGHTEQRDDGWSWTTQHHTAVWFAKRFANLEEADEAHVSWGIVQRDDVLAYFTGRGEAEILIDPYKVEITGMEVIERDESDRV